MMTMDIMSGHLLPHRSIIIPPKGDSTTTTTAGRVSERGISNAAWGALWKKAIMLGSAGGIESAVRIPAKVAKISVLP